MPADVDFSDLPKALVPRLEKANNRLATPFVSPYLEERDYGHEAEGLAYAKLAVQLVEELKEMGGGDYRSAVLNTLAKAYLANGLDDRAITASEAALDAALEKDKDSAEFQHSLIVRLVSNAKERTDREIRATELEIAALEDETRPWSFAKDQDRWWHSQLTKLVREIDAFANPITGLIEGTSPEFGWGVKRRLIFASEQPASDELAFRKSWDEAIASIRDRNRCPWYGGLALSALDGLVPIGQDEQSGLWEFYHVATGVGPVAGRDGRLVITEETGLVFVLIPGKEGLDPFLLSKYEMTQGQWLRIAGRNPSLHRHGGQVLKDNKIVRRTNPVEFISWADCKRLLGKFELALPSTEQWEHAARAEVNEWPWWTGESVESLDGAANLADVSLRPVSRGLRRGP